MSLLQGKDEYSVCVDPVDRERRELIDLINLLHDQLDRAAASLAPASVAELLESISAHLALEEKSTLDEAYGDPASDKGDHERLIDNLCDLIIMHAFEHPDDADCIELAQRLDCWFSNHFGTHDGNFSQCSPDRPRSARAAPPAVRGTAPSHKRLGEIERGFRS